eukprot:TRINITY_DN6206_c0_g1_i1.p1 TRINITY_DN6206_c0_g1~~TRINITY_DN6206_c0_g1_i1.p1  ORF type:complete len:821 (+),score=199.88 TRINITY_DN6206_c0_g1_i1:184-2646(+)
MPEKKELKDGLLLEEQACDDGGKKLLFHNTTVDKQFVCKYGFKGGQPEALGITRIEGEKWIVSVHPGEVQPFVKGKWSGTTKSISTGPPSKEWQEKQAGAAKDANRKQIETVQKMGKEAGIPPHASDKLADLCCKEKIPFVDTAFLPQDSSLQAEWQTKAGEMKMYPFKRPRDWECLKGSKAKLFVNKVEPADVNQGALADCYLMGALGSVAAEQGFLKQITFGAAQDEEFGVYRLWLCKDAWWQLVVVDDFLPCSGPKPAFARNRDEPNELWVALIEKAYSKVNGTYFAMKTGQCSMALADLTGCPHKTVAMDEALWEQTVMLHKKGAMQVMGTPGKNLMYTDEAKQSPEDKKLWEKYRAVDLICEHSYSLLDVRVTKAGQRLCCVRNPWGNTQHGLWKGRFGPDSEEMTPDLKKELGVQEGPSADGIFWMAWEDCSRLFTSVSIGHLNRGWRTVRVAGKWAEGCSNVMVDLDIKGKSKMWVGYHQPDTRGIKPGSSPNATYCGMNLFVGAPKKDGSMRVVESTSSNKRDGFKEMNLDSEDSKCGPKLFVVAQPKDAGVSKDFVLSFHVEDPGAVTFNFNVPKGKPPRHETAKEIKPDEWTSGDVTHQVDRDTKKGKKVGSGASRPAAAHADPAASPSKALKAKDTADIAAKPSSPKASAATRSRTAAAPGSPARKLMDRELQIEVHIIGASNLTSKGSSNTFCEIKLREVIDGRVGQDHSHPQKQQTKVKEKDLNPNWDEKFRFTVPGSDCIRVSVFGKKMMGKDYLGRVDLMMPQLCADLVPGGPAVKKKHTVAGEDEGRGPVSGVMEVAVKLLAVK